ncbi:hypothetical protein PMAYCL1PPCAC_13320, partial [Pristionchus mayeri]
YDGNGHVWQLNKETLTSPKCIDKKKCFNTTEDVKKICHNCILGDDSMPRCEKGVLRVGIESTVVLRCDDTTGKFKYHLGSTTADDLLEGMKALRCEEEGSNLSSGAMGGGSSDSSVVF